jgi:hypothetical protein
MQQVSQIGLALWHRSDVAKGRWIDGAPCSGPMPSSQGKHTLHPAQSKANLHTWAIPSRILCRQGIQEVMGHQEQLEALTRVAGAGVVQFSGECLPSMCNDPGVHPLHCCVNLSSYFG